MLIVDPALSFPELVVFGVSGGIHPIDDVHLLPSSRDTPVQVLNLGGNFLRRSSLNTGEVQSYTASFVNFLVAFNYKCCFGLFTGFDK